MLDETRLDEDETSLDETETTPATSKDEARLFALIAKSGAFIRPDSGLGVRLVSLIERRGIVAVYREASRLSKGEQLSDRQWVFGLERALEAIPTGADARAADVEEEREKRSTRIAEQMQRRRIEQFRFTGQWDPEWGPTPELDGVA